MASSDGNFSSLVGHRLEEERGALGLTQEELAGRAGVSRAMWGKYVRGESVPGGEVLAALQELGADVAYVLTGKRNPFAPKLHRATVLNTREERLLVNYHHASEAGRRALEATAAALAADHVRPLDDEGTVPNLVVHGSVTGQAAGRDMTIHHQPAPPPRGPRKG